MINDALTLEIFEALMAQDTINPPGNEKRGALCLKEIFDREGIPCEVQDLGDNRANFIASFGEGDKILEYSGHLDVVPCVGDWQHTAIGTTEEGELIYGRGACDMKGGVAAMCSAAISMFRDKTPLNGQIRLTFVADEEDANLGMHAFLDSHKAATYTILGEPTDLHVAIAHRGVGRYYIDLLGHACHAALRSTEETAVAKAARAVMAIEDLNKQLESMTHDVLPSPSIVVTMVQGYEKDNVVPGKVRLLVDFRVLPGMTEPQTRKLVQDALDAHGIVGFELTKHFFMRLFPPVWSRPRSSTSERKRLRRLALPANSASLWKPVRRRLSLALAASIRRIRWMSLSKRLSCSAQQSCIAKSRWMC